MERKYTDCKNALTSDCPNRNNELMLATLASESNKEITLEVFDRASSLCVKCEKFAPWVQQFH